MNKENFNKGIEGLRNIRMTDVEKARMLERIFATPIKSPYMKRIPVFAYISSLFLIVAISGATYASSNSLPGDIFYPVKTRVIEPVLDVVNYTPEDTIVWEEQKVERRIAEAEGLAKKDALDDKKLKQLERGIEKSSSAFAQAVNTVASSTTNSTTSAKEKADTFKQEFRKKLNERNDVVNQNEDDSNVETTNKEQQSESKSKKIKRLKDTAIRVVDDEDDSRNRDRDND